MDSCETFCRAPDPNPAQPPGAMSVCKSNLFEAEPQLLPLMRTGSLIEQFYCKFGAREPLQGAIAYQTGKTLVRKVAAVHHALRTLPLGTRVVWSDFDAIVLQQLEGSPFDDFVSQYDLTYIPMRTKNLNSKTPMFIVESGVMAFTVSERSRALAAAAMELYAGGMLSLKRSCSAAGWKGACSPVWLQGNTFLNDVYVWTILLHALLHNSTVFDAHAPSLTGAVGLRQAWFGINCSCPHWRGGNPPGVLDFLYSWASWCDAPGKCPCPGTNTTIIPTAPFSLVDYIWHDLKSSQFSRSKTPSIWWLAMPKAGGNGTCGRIVRSNNNNNEYRFRWE